MKAKFKHGQAVFLNGEPDVITVLKKNFSTGIVEYRMESGLLVKESELSTVKQPSPKTIQLPVDEKLSTLQKEYKEAYGKKPPINKKNDKVWLAEKIKEAKGETPWEVLLALDSNALIALIDRKKLDIEVEDYDEENELRIAVADELGVEIPE